MIFPRDDFYLASFPLFSENTYTHKTIIYIYITYNKDTFYRNWNYI